MYTELTAREKSPCPVAEPTGRLKRESWGPRDGDRAPDAPPPTGLPALAPGPLSPCLGLLSRPARLQLWLSGLTSPETRCQSRGRSARKRAPGHCPAPPESRWLKPEGHREQWTGEARPPPRSLATENCTWKLCFPIGEYGPSRAEGGSLGQWHCGRCSPSSRP